MKIFLAAINLRLINPMLLVGFAVLLMAVTTDNDSKKKAARHVENNEFEQALSIFNELIADDVDNINLLNQRANILLKLHESDQAMLDFQKILEIDNSNLKGLLGMARYHAYQFHVTIAIEYLDSAAENITNESQYDYLITRGKIMMNFEMYAEAETALLNAAIIRADDHLINLLVSSLKVQGKYSEIIEYLNMVSDENNMTANSLARMGFLMNSIAQYAEANLYLEQALNVEANNAEALRNIAFTYLKLGKSKEALKKIEKSLRQDPLNPYSYRVKGEILRTLDKETKAIKNLNRAISLNYIELYGEDILLLLQ